MIIIGWYTITLPDGRTLKIPNFALVKWPKVPKKWRVIDPDRVRTNGRDLKPQPQPWVRRPDLGSAGADHALDDLMVLSGMHELATRLHDPGLTERVQGVVADIAEGVAGNIPGGAATVNVRPS